MRAGKFPRPGRRWAERGRPGRGLARLVAPIGAIALLTVVLTSCVSLSSGYTYMSHRSPDGTILYFKVPSNWVRYGFPDDIRGANGALTQSQVNQIQGARWYVTFGEGPQRPNLFSNISSKRVQGVAFAAQLNATERDQFSLQALRSEILGEDPLSQSSSSPFNVISYHEFTLGGGIRGSSLETNISDGNLTDTFAQVVDVDPQTNWVFALGIGCRASCWGPNSGTIKQILSAWNVKEQS